MDAVWALLRAGGFCIAIEGDGSVHIGPMPSEPSLVLSQASARMLRPEVSYSTPVSVKNRCIAVLDGKRAVAENRESHDALGLWDDVYDDSPVLVGGETLEGYAARRLEEESVIEDSRTYTRLYSPGVHPFSVVRGSIGGLDGDLRVKSQSIDISHGIKVTETAAREVRTWTA